MFILNVYTLCEVLIENQVNFQLIKTLLKYTKYYSSCSYIYENEPSKDKENLQNFLDEFELKINDLSHKNENIISLLIHPYLYGISYLDINKVEYLQRYSRAVKSIFPKFEKNNIEADVATLNTISNNLEIFMVKKEDKVHARRK